MKNTLLYRLGIFNALVFGWIGVTDFSTGWLRTMITADLSYMSYFILAMFAAMIVSTAYQAFELNYGVNNFIANGNTPEGPLEAKGEFRLEAITHIYESAGVMATLGLVGTLAGLNISIGGVSLDALSSADGLKEIGVKLVAGLRTEIGVTIVGAIAGAITLMNYVSLRYSAAWLAHKESK